MKVLVCGGREYGENVAEVEFLFNDLDARHAINPIELVVQGGARGADSVARLWAESREIDCLIVPARWSIHGPSAGPIRNGRMLEYKPDLVIAFTGGRGTANMVKQARKAGIAVAEPR